MSSILRLRLSGTVVLVALCVATTAVFAARAQRTPDAVPSQLLSDDERVDFCAQMQRATTPAARLAVFARLRDTLTPRASVQAVALPSWLLDGREPRASGRSKDSIPGLGCAPGAASHSAPAATQTPAAPSREVAVGSTSRSTPVASMAPAPVRDEPAQPRSRPEAPVPTTANASAAAVAAIPDAAHGGLPAGRDHGIDFVTGGVGEDEAAALRQLASSYNMRATFTLRNGEYLSGVAVQVSRADGTVMLSTHTEGPYLFARLPSGHYRVLATVDGMTRARELYVPSRGGVHFTLTWPNASAR
ncbi:hypothetical protein [Paraburkholderia gardini]|uniref:Carboxypeptidase regulatory-like domain-containing protein n=1 Tax=Paraburkholderia gardini TaxID=2823469 RepID=A0ABM8TZZ1_9BURK|nr:hypothetical protein [Paraburkholderia gardini]CAG4891359.1 hypothetical protein R54767_01110 [Paraburkholderia gardini]